LLNAKLLYVNKVFKAKNLTESQKLKVIAQFDKATTAQEAKTIFESMNSAIAKSAKKSTIKESLGFASKAAGNAPQKQIVQVDETVSRWQMLAGIK
jgi:N12 class adenine-specific DNA methylase